MRSSRPPGTRPPAAGRRAPCGRPFAAPSDVGRPPAAEDGAAPLGLGTVLPARTASIPSCSAALSALIETSSAERQFDRTSVLSQSRSIERRYGTVLPQGSDIFTNRRTDV